MFKWFFVFNALECRITTKNWIFKWKIGFCLGARDNYKLEAKKIMLNSYKYHKKTSNIQKYSDFLFFFIFIFPEDRVESLRNIFSGKPDLPRTPDEEWYYKKVKHTSKNVLTFWISFPEVCNRTYLSTYQYSDFYFCLLFCSGLFWKIVFCVLGVRGGGWTSLNSFYIRTYIMIMILVSVIILYKL